MVRLGIQVCLLCSLLVASPLAAQDAGTTTWFVVRHADRDGESDALTAAGEQRAEQLRDLMNVFRVRAVYSTDTQRTQRTAAPTATALNLAVTTYGALTNEWFEQIKSKHRGTAVLIVAHSNTAGEIVKGLGGQGDFSIADDQYDSLFIVTSGPHGSSALRVKFGD